MEKVTFISEGTPCSAYLCLPESGGTERHPGVVLGHGFGIRKESLVVEAEHLAAAGFVALAIDYRTFGESGGEPRGSLIPVMPGGQLPS
jgi:cephalosporin-C deacetylase-like acetyl esterase